MNLKLHKLVKHKILLVQNEKGAVAGGGQQS